jgi:hypothetical protein
VSDWRTGTGTQFLNQEITWRVDRLGIAIDIDGETAMILDAEQALNMITGLSLLYAELRNASTGP